MGRYTGPKCKLCRREGEKLFLKGSRCYSSRCAFEKKSFPPGQHGQRRTKLTDYALQLREKQKVKRMYGLLEKQFHKYFVMAERKKGITGANLLVILETRLDNLVYRMGFANSRSQARQLVNHCHFAVNGGKVDISSYLCKEGDVVSVRERSREMDAILNSLDRNAGRIELDWIELDKKKLEGKLVALPKRESIGESINEQLIVELYSK